MKSLTKFIRRADDVLMPDPEGVLLVVSNLLLLEGGEETVKAPAPAPAEVGGAMLLAPLSRVVGVKALPNATHDDRMRTERAAALPKEGFGAGVAGSNAIVLWIVMCEE